MALTYSPKIHTPIRLPEFTLHTVEGKLWSSNSIADAPTKVVIFMCNHCPYIKAIETRIIRLANDLQKKNVAFIGVCSNDPADYPEDEPKELLKTWREKKYNFPYLIDDKQTLAKAFGAVCTPDIFVYDKNSLLRYRGRIDDSWRDESKVTKHELRDAVDAILKNMEPNQEQNPSMGCSIKWKD